MTQLSFTLTPPEPRSRRPDTPVTRELRRRSKNAQAVLDRLRRGPATTFELITVGGTRAPGRVHELRQDGYQITATNHGGGKWVYELEQP